MKWIAVGLGALALAGCASSPIPLESAEVAPSSKVFAFQTKTSPVAGKITVLRDSGVTGSACDVGVYIDGVRAANLATGQKASFWVAAGTRNLSIGPSNSGICTGTALRTLSADVAPGEEKAFRVSGDMQGVYLNPYVRY